MNARRLFSGLCLSVLCLAAASPALGNGNRVFVSARSGNDANACENINLPCQTFAGAMTHVNPDGEVIVLDSGGYGPVTITQGVTIEAPAGVTAFIHPPSSGDAITVNAGTAKVTLRGLVLNDGDNGILVTSVGRLNVENCFITGFSAGIVMSSAGRLNVKGADIKECALGILISNSSGLVRASIDHCHLDGNSVGYIASLQAPGSLTMTASYTTANNNISNGWHCGNGQSGRNLTTLEFCTGSENGDLGLIASSDNVLSALRYSNCVFSNNGEFGVKQIPNGTVESRGNNTITGNGVGPTSGTIGTFLPM